MSATPRVATAGRPTSCVRPRSSPGSYEPRPGSALISVGETRVICTASVQDSVPRWLAGSGRGWVTAEYGMLPASTGERKQRDVSKGRPDGRTVEIQRLIGRSLRVVVDFEALGERSIYVDCDVLQADGGTRCASITGGMVALRLAFNRLLAEGRLERLPLTGNVAAVSCGIVDGRAATGPRLLGGLGCRGGRQRRDRGRGWAGRGPGDGRADTAVTGAPRRAAGAGRGRASRASPPSRTRRWRPRSADHGRGHLAGSGDPQSAQGEGGREGPCTGRDRGGAIAHGGGTAARGRHLVCGKRAAEGAGGGIAHRPARDRR